MTPSSQITLPHLSIQDVAAHMATEPDVPAAVLGRIAHSYIKQEFERSRMGSGALEAARWATAQWFGRHHDWAYLEDDAVPSPGWIDESAKEVEIAHKRRGKNIKSTGKSDEVRGVPGTPSSAVDCSYQPGELLPVERRIRARQILTILHCRIGEAQYDALADSIGKNLPMKAIGAAHGASADAAATSGRIVVSIALDAATRVRRRVAELEDRDEFLPEGLLAGYTFH